LFFAINFIGNKYYERKNFAGQAYTDVGSQTINVLSALEEEIQIINYFSPGTNLEATMIQLDVEKILEEYEYHGKGKVSVRRVDPELDFEEAQIIAKEFKLSVAENILIVQVGDQHRTINYSDLAVIDNSGTYYGMPPKLTSFLAEEKITEAIDSLTRGEKSTVYFLTGHGEYDPKSDNRDKLGYSLLAERIGRQNIEVRTLNLVQVGQIPEDCDVLIIAGPRTKLLPEEIELLRLNYQPNDEQPNRLILMLDPQTETGLESLLAESYGIEFEDDVLLVNLDFLGQVRTLAQTVVADFPPHPSMQWTRSLGSQVQLELGSTRSIKRVENTSNLTEEQVIDLLMTPKGYWGETGALTGEVQYDPGEDHAGPLTVGVLIDEGRISGGEVQLKGDRIVALGSANFLINESIQAYQVDLILNYLNWMLERDSSLGITPKSPAQFQVRLEGSEITTIAAINGALILFSLGAILVTWLRRRK
ncbi:MAG: GldG family protein, partial [Verrucomicrobiota bacterium]